MPVVFDDSETQRTPGAQRIGEVLLFLRDLSALGVSVHYGVVRSTHIATPITSLRFVLGRATQLVLAQKRNHEEEGRREPCPTGCMPYCYSILVLI